MKTIINVGDYVRNTKSGKCGHVAGKSADNKRLTVLTINRSYVSWAAKNVELIKDAKK